MISVDSQHFTILQPTDFHPRPATSVHPAAFVSFLEGPAEGPDGTVYFSDIKGNRLLALEPRSSTVRVVREPSGRANGNVFDLDGRLVTCEGAEYGPGGGRRLVRTDVSSGELALVTDTFEDGRYNSPNDVCVDSRGRIYFTDPCYNDYTVLEQDAEAVYRVDLDGTTHRIVSQPEIERPNGLAVAPDDSELYVVDSNHSPGGNRKLWAFRLDGDGNAHDQRLVWDFGDGRGGDGVEVAADGTLFVCAGIRIPRSPGESALYPPGVYLISPAGEPLDCIPIPEDVISNCCFAGEELRTLYVTAGRMLYSIPVERGYHAFSCAGAA
jgi:gluconolactonase